MLVSSALFAEQNSNTVNADFLNQAQTLSQHDFTGKTETPVEAMTVAKQFQDMSNTIQENRTKMIGASFFSLDFIPKLKNIIYVIRTETDRLLALIKNKMVFTADDNQKITAIANQISNQQTIVSDLVVNSSSDQNSNNNTLSVFAK